MFAEGLGLSGGSAGASTYAAPISIQSDFVGSNIVIGDGNSLEDAPRPQNLNPFSGSNDQLGGVLTVGAIGFFALLILKMVRG